MSVVTNQLGCCGVKGDRQPGKQIGMAVLQLYLSKQVACWIWPMGHSLPTAATYGFLLFPKKRRRKKEKKPTPKPKPQ